MGLDQALSRQAMGRATQAGSRAARRTQRDAASGTALQWTGSRNWISGASHFRVYSGFQAALVEEAAGDVAGCVKLRAEPRRCSRRPLVASVGPLEVPAG